MYEKIIKVFYDTDLLPYKDKARTVHFPIIGSSFLGASETTKIRFYYGNICSPSNTLVAESKRPNGTNGRRILTKGEDEDGLYGELSLTSWYLEYKGDLYISLKCFAGDVETIYDEEEREWQINGTPIIQATGAIKLSVNYTPIGPFANYQDEFDTYQDVLGALGEKLEITSGIVVVSDIDEEPITNYDEGQLLYDVSEKALYKVESGEFKYFPMQLPSYKVSYSDKVIDYILNNNLDRNKSIVLEYEPSYLAYKVLYIGKIYLAFYSESENIGIANFSFQQVADKTRYKNYNFPVDENTTFAEVFSQNNSDDFVTDNSYLPSIKVTSETYVADAISGLDKKPIVITYNEKQYFGKFNKLQAQGVTDTYSFYLFVEGNAYISNGYVNLYQKKFSDIFSDTYLHTYADLMTSNIFNYSPQTNEQITDASADTKLTTKKYVKDMMDNHLGDYNVLNEKVSAIESKIPSEASSSNKLADKDFVNSTINSLAAFYITKNAQGDPFATYAELESATIFYSGGQVRVPTRNDYCMVNADETHDGASCRYIYQGTQWEFQFVVNETPFTADQLAAINSGITQALVSQITTNALAITSINSKLPKIKDFVIPTNAWQLDEVSGKYYAELDAGNDFVIDDNFIKNYTGTSSSDNSLIMMYGIIATSNATTQKFKFECLLGSSAPDEAVNYTISMYGGN